MQVGVADLTEPLQWLSFHGNDGVDLAPAQPFERDPRLDIEQMRLDPETFEHVDGGYERAAIRQVDGYRLAVEILHTLDRHRREDVHFLVEHFGDIDKL